MPEGTNSHLHQLRRTVLKDIKNDPSGNNGLKRPLGSLKRRISDSACLSSLQLESRPGKGDKAKDRDCGLSSAMSEKNKNIYTDITNISTTVQDKERNKGILCETEISLKSVSKYTDGVASPAFRNEMSPMSHKAQVSSPDSCLASSILGMSDMSLPYFGDSTGHNKSEQDIAEFSTINSDKYFSTPMPSKDRVRNKKLTPVMEIESDSSISEEPQHQEKVPTTEMLHENSAVVVLHESPTQTPLYRSFFAAECQEIAKQIEGIKPDEKLFPGKRKSEELDVSTIDAEPPPYDCTPMKSMLACEVAKMLSSFESSPNKEGLSLFGYSILDLEKTDMQISYFTSPKCDIESNKRHSTSGAEQLSLSDSAYTTQPKRQKTEPFEKSNLEVNVNQVNKMSPLTNVDSFTSLGPTVDLHISTTKCSEGINAVFSNSVILPEHKLSDSLVEPALLMKDTAIAPLVVSPVCEGSTGTCIKHLFQTSEQKLCANTTQDNVWNNDELPPADTTRVFDRSNTRPRSTSKQEMTRVPRAFNTTQDMLFIQEGINRSNTTQVIEMMGIQSFSTTLDIVQVQHDATPGNATQVMDIVPPSANTTQDIAPVHSDAVLSNTTQVIDVVLLSANTTQDVTPVHDDAASSNTTQVIDAPLSTNTTQDVAPVPKDAASSNTTQVIDVVLLSANTTQDVAPVHDDAASSNTTQVIDVVLLSANTTQDVAPVHDEAASSNTTQVIDAPLSTNTTQDVAPVHNDAASSNTTQVIDAPVHDDAASSNTTQVIDVVLLSANTTQDVSPVQDVISSNTTQVMDAPLSTNTTQDVTPIHEVCITANTTQIIEDQSQIPVNNTVDIPSMHESKTSNTTYGTEMGMRPCVNTTQNIVSMNDQLLTACTPQDNEIILQGSANRSFGATSSDKITTGSSQDIGVMKNSSIVVLPSEEAIHTHSTDAAPKPLGSSNLSHDEITSTNNDRLLKDVTHASLSTAFNVSPQCSVRIGDTNLPGTTGRNTEISASNDGSSLNAENKENLVISNNQKNVSRLDPTQETLVVNDIKEWPSEPEAKISHSDFTCVTPDFSPPAQIKPNGTERQHIGGHEKLSDCCTGMASSRKEADFCKESGNRPLLSESCSMIQEEENAHDVSVFSVGSLSFVTSTPVPGLSNFQFQNSCRDSVQHDSNVSIGLVLDDSSNKVPGEQRMIPQQRSHGANRLDCKDKAKQETSRVSFLPPNMQKKTMVPQSDAMPKQMPSTSAIPSARRSLALYQNASHNPVRETVLSKIAPRSGIPGRGMIRPPLARQSLARATLGNAKQGPDSTGGSSITNKLAENRFRTPSAAAVVKAKSVTTHSQLPAAPSSIKPPSRIVAPGTTGRVSIGIHNAVPDQHDTPRGDPVLAVQPPVSAGIRPGPPRPGMPSVRPPLQQLQKVSLKPKSQVQGIPTKKTQRELPTLGFRKDSASKPESTTVVRSNAKPTNLALDSTKQAASFQAEMAEGKPERCRHLQMSKCCQLLKAYEDFKRHYELAKSELESCQHLEGCTCCQLLKMYEDFKRLFGAGGKRQGKRNNVSDQTPAEEILNSMSAAIASSQQSQSGLGSLGLDACNSAENVVPAKRRLVTLKKKNYTDTEMELLVDEIILNYKLLFPGKNDKIPMALRNSSWNQILDKVNALGVAKRTVNELKKKWCDLKNKVKAKMAAIAKYSRQTGGGPSCEEKLTPLEEKVGVTCSREQIEGFGAVDVCMAAVNARAQENLPEEETQAQSPEEHGQDEIENPDYVVDDLILGEESVPINYSSTNEHPPFPSDLGLSSQQNYFLNEYTKQQLNFMSSVDKRLADLEKAILKQGEQNIQSAVSLTKGLHEISNVLERLVESRTADSTSVPLSNLISAQHLQHTLPTQLLSQPSTEQATSIVSKKSDPQVPESERERSSTFNVVPEEDEVDDPIDLTVSKSTDQQTSANRIDSGMTSQEQRLASATFLLRCKKELAYEKEELPKSKRKSQGQAIQSKCRNPQTTSFK